jgi:hypothetical protein
MTLGELWVEVRTRYTLATTAIASTGRQFLEVVRNVRDASSSLLRRAIIDPAKWRYLFGEVTSGRTHNIERSAQNASQLARIGVFNNDAGRSILRDHFSEIVTSNSNIIRFWFSEHGTFLERESLLVGPGGFLKLWSTWQVVADNVQRLTTVIPVGGG